MRVRLDSLGCRLNIGETESLARRFATLGHRVVGPGDAADLFVFNTCAVTHVAARKSRKALRQIRRTNPTARIVVTGCYADLSPEGVGELGVDLVVSNHDKDRLVDLLATRDWLHDADPLPGPRETPFADLPGSRTRAFVKVQDGCDNRCTFCIVTVARGAARSRPVAEVVAEIEGLARSGYREVVLSGVHLGSYGHDRGRREGLRELVGEVLARTPIRRLRLSSLEPWDLSPDFFDLWQNPRMQPHLHLPLQSGCDVTLARMARRTTTAEFTALVEDARAAIPDLAVSTDVIVGFPGEDDAEFDASLAYVGSLDLSRLHVFRYSPRQGTAAARMPGQVEPDVSSGRSRRMHALGDRAERAYRKRHVGRRMEVLWETAEETDSGRRWCGLTGNYLRAVTETAEGIDLHNRIEEVQLAGCVPGALAARRPS